MDKRSENCVKKVDTTDVADIKKKTIGQVFEEKQRAWEARMDKVFSDLYPLKHNTAHVPTMEKRDGKKDADAFAKLSISTVLKDNKKAEEEFLKILKDQKKEFLEAIQQFDNVIELEEKRLQMEYETGAEKKKERVLWQETMMNEIERYLLEVEETGDTEIENLKDSLYKHLEEVENDIYAPKIDAIYEEADEKKLSMDLLKECIDITSTELQSSFKADQKETIPAWKKAYQDVLVLERELEKYRYNYAEMRANMERGIEWMRKNDNVDENQKVQRQLSCLESRKKTLAEELQNLKEEIKTEEKRDIKHQYDCKIAALKDRKEKTALKAYSRREIVFKEKESEIFSLLSGIQKGDKFIFEEILHLPWASTETKTEKQKERVKIPTPRIKADKKGYEDSDEETDWSSILASIPETHLWNSVILLLEQYRELLASRKRLITIKTEVEAENAGIRQMLANYYSADQKDRENLKHHDA